MSNPIKKVNAVSYVHINFRRNFRQIKVLKVRSSEGKKK